MTEIRDVITPEDFRIMRQSVGWTPFSSVQSAKALSQSMAVCGIYEDGVIAAMGRLVGDGTCKAMLTDIITKPECQGKGYGRTVTEHLISSARHMLEAGETMCIESNPTAGNRDFYIRCGMEFHPEEQDGVYIWIHKN